MKKFAKRQSAEAEDSAQQEGESICEVTATRKTVTRDSVAPVSPAVSPAVPLSNGREQLTIETSDTTHQSGSQSGNGNTKPNCYECKHRRNADFSAHSVCQHPRIGEIGQFLEVAFLLRGLRGPAMKRLNVSGNPHGIKSGWFTWPLDFDPVWLHTCDGFEAKP